MAKQTTRPTINNDGSVANTSLDRLNNMLIKAKPVFDKIAGKYIDAERMARIVMAAARRPPKYPGMRTLADCDPRSVLLAVMEAAQIGLEPETPFGHCYLIPYKQGDGQDMVVNCQLQIGYQGLAALALRDPHIRHIEARMRYEKDRFMPKYAPIISLEHDPCLDEDPGMALGAYAIVHFDDGTLDFEYCRAAEIISIQKGIKGSDSTYSPWQKSRDAMWCKTALKRGCNRRWARAQESLARAAIIDNEVEAGTHTPSPELLDALDGIDPPRRLSAPSATPPNSQPVPQQEAAQTPPPAEQAPAQQQRRGPSAPGLYDGDPEPPPPSDREPGVD